MEFWLRVGIGDYIFLNVYFCCFCVIECFLVLECIFSYVNFGCRGFIEGGFRGVVYIYGGVLFNYSCWLERI